MARVNSFQSDIGSEVLPLLLAFQTSNFQAPVRSKSRIVEEDEDEDPIPLADKSKQTANQNVSKSSQSKSNSSATGQSKSKNRPKVEPVRRGKRTRKS